MRQSKLEKLTCPVCNKEFKQNRTFQTYCSRECMLSAQYKKHSEKRSELRKEMFDASDKKRTCPVCSTEFELTKNNPQKIYCCKKCKAKANRILALDKARFGGNKKAVLERDGYKCVLCSGDNRLAVHHKDMSGTTDNPNNDIDNLIALCNSCHTMLHMQLKKGNDILKNYNL